MIGVLRAMLTMEAWLVMFREADATKPSELRIHGSG